MTSTASSSLFSKVDDVLITAQLADRPSKAPDYKRESRALELLAQEMASNPHGVLQKCADLVMELCQADSAGISILEPSGASGVLRWHAAAGLLAPNLHGTMPIEASPCGTVMERNCVLLFQEAERFFPALRGIEPRIYENLLTPWHAEGKAVGTLWAIKHTQGGRFDAEDARVIQSIARFAAAAFKMTAAYEDATAERTALRESEKLRRIALESGGMGAWTWDTRDRTVRADEAFQDLWGVAFGNDLHPVSTYADRMDTQGAASLEAVMAKAPVPGQEFQDQVQVASGVNAGRWVQWRGRAEMDKPWIINGVSFDITEQRELAERQQVLVAELQHRTRNILAVVRSMADKTARASADLSDFRDRFRDRLEALSRVQGLLSRLNEHDRVTFDELIETELAALGDGAGRVRLDGPKGVRLRSSMVQTLAMALHELATNATKYGALGQPGAHLDVTWGLSRDKPDEESRLHIDWRESGVEMPPTGSRPNGGGQGRELIEKALPYQLSARTTYELGPDGVHCTISIPISTTPAQEDVHA